MNLQIPIVYLLLWAFTESAIARNHNRKGVNLTESFSRVYHRKEWGPEGGGSGGGSTLKTTRSIRIFLYHFIVNNTITSFLDAPCGAMEWQPSALRQIEASGKIANFTYTGMDIVPSLIDHNTRRFSKNHPNWVFIYGDIASMPIVKSKSGSKLLLTTSNPGAPNHNESTSWKVPLNEGGFRDVDMCAPPLSLPKPVYVLEEKESSRIMAVWVLPFPKLFTHDVAGNVLNCNSVLS